MADRVKFSRPSFKIGARDKTGRYVVACFGLPKVNTPFSLRPYKKLAYAIRHAQQVVMVVKLPNGKPARIIVDKKSINVDPVRTPVYDRRHGLRNVSDACISIVGTIWCNDHPVEIIASFSPQLMKGSYVPIGSAK